MPFHSTLFYSTHIDIIPIKLVQTTHGGIFCLHFVNPAHDQRAFRTCLIYFSSSVSLLATWYDWVAKKQYQLFFQFFKINLTLINCNVKSFEFHLCTFSNLLVESLDWKSAWATDWCLLHPQYTFSPQQEAKGVKSRMMLNKCLGDRRMKTLNSSPGQK